jgi:integrase/recombinase XerC
MANDLVPLPAEASSVPAIGSVGDVLEAWLSGRNPRTLKAYRFDLTDFARSVNAPSPAAAIDALLAGSAGLANRVALAYRADLLHRGLSSATIARRLSALRSLVKLARQLGRITWALDVEGPRIVPYRDTTGPGRNGWTKIHSDAKRRAGGTRRTAEAKRNLALLRLLHDLALRRGEAIAMDLADVELDFGDTGRTRIIGKGRTQAEFLTLNERTRDALKDWIACRPPGPGPLFVRLDNARGDGVLDRLTGDSVNRMVRQAATNAGIERRVRAHGLRHQGITRALDLTDGDVRKVKKFSRHAKYETLGMYDDNRQDEAGKIARQLGADD